MYNVTEKDVDYHSGPHNVTFIAGVTSVSFDVLINDDNLIENFHENFNLTIDPFSLPNGVTTGPLDQTIVIIQDNDSKFFIW